MKTRKAVRPKTISKQWKIKYIAEGDEFLFTFRDDGTGTCRDVDGRTEVAFEWNPRDTKEQDGAACQEALQELAAELFWSEINEQFGEDAIVTDEYLFEYSEELDVEFTCGSRQELNDLTRLTLYSFPSIWSDGSVQRFVRYMAEGESSGERAALEDDGYDPDLGIEITDADRARVVELLEFAVGRNTPAGEYLAYNDGAYHRKSGYSWCVKRETVEVGRPSFHEMAGARSHLRERLKPFLSTSDLDRLLPAN